MATEVNSISGYLHKKTRDGRWQKRWFETNGCFLTYYKSKKMTKLLAALDLVQVGTIQVVTKPEPGDEGDLGCLFSIELNERIYTLKAGDPTEATKWVDVLNQLKAGGNQDLQRFKEEKDAYNASNAQHDRVSGLDIEQGGPGGSSPKSKDWRKAPAYSWLCGCSCLKMTKGS